MAYKINHANIKDWARDYDGEPFDGILCDPPYELGFMGKSWDSSGIAFDSDMWADLFRHVKPGGHLLAFSGSRTYHRMACAIEDAGFEIRDMIEWVYGSGFPKSLNIGKAVDKIHGNERENLGVSKNHRTLKPTNTMVGEPHSGDGSITKGTSPYEGYGTALKPAHEPCVLARKPLEKGMTVAQTALKHGTGGLNIDGSRVEYEKGGTKATNPTLRTDNGENSKDYGKSTMFARDRAIIAHDNAGRFPANLIHDGSDEVVGLFPDTKGSSAPRTNSPASKQVYGDYGQVTTHNESWGDSGSAARFFYTAKASKSERNAGLEGFEEKDSSKMSGGEETRPDRLERGLTNHPTAANHHPTVKPLSLTKYLANLIKPPTGGRLLVPFSGSGSEMIGALQAGWEYVEGVELTEEYIPIAEARIKHWLDKMSKEQLEML